MVEEIGSAPKGRKARKEIPVEELPLDKCFEELEAIVDALERGNLSLEESLKLFERGMALSRRCMRELEAIEQRIEMIVEDAKGEVKTVPFAPENIENGDE